MFRLFKVIKELSLYREYIRIIKKEETDSPIWARRNLRRDYLNRIYTVVNLPPQVLLSVDLPRDARPSFVISELKPTNEYFKSLNLEELLTMWIEPVKGTDEESYLAVYQFLFRHLSWLWILRFLIEVSLITFIIIKWDWVLNLFNLA
jgi:hypothetical protein